MKITLEPKNNSLAKLAKNNMDKVLIYMLHSNTQNNNQKEEI